MIEESLIAFLKDQPNVAALVGSRIVMLAAAENVRRPLVVLFRSSTRRISSKTGLSGDVRVAVELHCVAADPGGMMAVAEAVRQSLDGFKGDLAGVPVSHVGITNERDAYEPEARLYVRVLSCVCWYSE